MVKIDQSGLKGKIRDRPISHELANVLRKAASVAGVDEIRIISGGQPGTKGTSTGSTRHNGGRAADLQVIASGKIQTFSDAAANRTIVRFVTAAAAHGATGIGAGEDYMGPATLHIGFGLNPNDRSKVVWGAKGKPGNAPQWLRQAANEGWSDPPVWAFPTDDRFTEDLPEDQDAPFEEEEEVEVIFDIPERFSLEVVKAAQASQRLWRIPASVTLAQWALESAYGARMPPGSNNPFGIKARGNQPSVTTSTSEYIGGVSKTVVAAFRAFDSLEEAFISHGKLLGSSAIYANARQFISNPDRFADALTNVYATDPEYGAKLKSIMKKNGLYKFDVRTDDVPSSRFLDGEVDVFEPFQPGDTMRILALQKRLVELGYKLGDIDGKFGSLTAGALLSFQHDNGLPTTGILDRTTEEALNTADHRRLGEKRIKRTEKELAADGSRIVIDARRGRILSWIGGVLGAIGLGNSAIVNAVDGTGSRAASTLPDTLLPLLADVQKLAPGATPDSMRRLSDLARDLTQQIGGNLPPEVLQTLEQLRQSTLSSNPDVANAIQQVIAQTATSSSPAMTTVFDILPSFFANDTVLQTVMKGVAAVGGSVLPGVGGSLAMLGIGLAGRLLANRIAAARVEDHRTAGNVNSLGN